MIPGWLLELQPDGNDLLIYATLASFGQFDTLAGTYEECRPALATIAERAAVSLSTVKRSIGNLLRLGAIERTQRHAEDGKTQLPSVYRVIFGTIVGPQEQGGSTGEPRGGSTGEPGGSPRVSQDPEPQTQNQDTQKPSPSARGTRLPEGWTPTQKLVDWCRDELVPGARWSEHSREFVRRQTGKFADYFAAAPGQRGVKKDWDATWRNWMRTAFERDYAPNRPVSGPPAPFKTAAERNAEEQKRRLERARLAEQIREEEKVTIQEAYRLAGERMANGLDTCTATGYIDGEIIDERQREVTAK